MSISSTSDGLAAPLIAADAPPEPPLSPSHAIGVVRPCPLLHVPPPIRSLILDYVDDLSAIRCLSTCRSLHAGYHAYPLKQAMPEAVLQNIVQLHERKERARRVRKPAVIVAVVQIAVLLFLVYVYQPWVWRPQLVFPLIIFALFVATWCPLLGWLLLSRRRECCSKGRWCAWIWWWRPVPRVVKLKGELQDVRLLPYLQHLNELGISCNDSSSRRFSLTRPLPCSLRTLRLHASPHFTLTPHALPSRLTSLSLSSVKSMPLGAGVLPQSLTSLRLTHGFDTTFGIPEGVLPRSLQQLQLDEWQTLPLSHIALPASLIQLSVHWLSNHPLPVLPPQLEVLCIGGAFNQPLTGVLPASLRVLELVGHFSQPLTSAVFASTPQLEELHLGDHGGARHLVASALPRSLRVLRAGADSSLVMASELPPQLQLLILPASWNLMDAERVTRLEQLAQARGIIVVHE